MQLKGQENDNENDSESMDDVEYEMKLQSLITQIKEQRLENALQEQARKK